MRITENKNKKSTKSNMSGCVMIFKLKIKKEKKK